MTEKDQVYGFLMRGLLSEEALDAAGRKLNASEYENQNEIEKLAGIDTLDESFVSEARQMASVYIAVAAFEKSVRELISKTLLENIGENWWEECVSNNIRTAAKTRMDDEEKVRWHSQRGQDPINYTMLPHLMNIIRQNQAQFEPFVHDLDWAHSIFDTIERSRNVIMHSGTLSRRDVARLGSIIRDWTSQVST